MATKKTRTAIAYVGASALALFSTLVASTFMTFMHGHKQAAWVSAGCLLLLSAGCGLGWLGTPDADNVKPVSTTINNDRGIVAMDNAHIESATVDNRQYGVPRPLPNIVVLALDLLPAAPRPEIPDLSESVTYHIRQQRIGELRRAAHGTEGPIWNPGVRITFHVDAPFTNPMFELRCDRSFVPVQILFCKGGNSRFSGSNPFFPKQDPTVVVIGSGDTTFLTSDVTVAITIRSSDSQPVNVIGISTYSQ